MLVKKHIVELDRMASEEHRSLVPLVEVALAIMRLSCEKWFSLVSIFVAFIVFRDPPIHVQEYIKIVAVMSRIFQQCILMSFPAVCWAYGAGFLFSSFASAVFWTTPAIQLVEHVKRVGMEVRPMHWHPVTHEEIERMGGNCAICWGTLVDHGAVDEDMGEHSGAEVDRIRSRHRSDARDGAEDAAMGLSCGHAYHRSCLLEWLQSCFGQSRKATCPMCQSQVSLSIKYKLRAIFPFGGTPDDQGAHREGVLPPRRAYPGLATLAQSLPDEFIGRFDFLMQEGVERAEAALLGDEREHANAAREEQNFASGSEDHSDDEARFQAAVMNLQAWLAQVEDDSEDESSVDFNRVHSAHALIISEDSANSGSSIHLPDTRCLREESAGSMSTEEEPGEEEQEQGERALSYLLRLRPRRNRESRG